MRTSWWLLAKTTPCVIRIPRIGWAPRASAFDRKEFCVSGYTGITDQWLLTKEVSGRPQVMAQGLAGGCGHCALACAGSEPPRSGLHLSVTAVFLSMYLYLSSDKSGSLIQLQLYGIHASMERSLVGSTAVPPHTHHMIHTQTHLRSVRRPRNTTTTTENSCVDREMRDEKWRGAWYGTYCSV